MTPPSEGRASIRRSLVSSTLILVAVLMVWLAVTEGSTIHQLLSSPDWKLVSAQQYRNLVGNSGVGLFILAYVAFLLRTWERDFGERLSQARKQKRDVEEAYSGVLYALTAALDLRDSETMGHSDRVSKYTLAIAAEMGLQTPEFTRMATWGALLHDIGKLGIRDAVLLKPGPLTAEEWAHMKEHPTLGAGMLSQIPFLSPAIETVLNHHEHWDGKGYPGGAKGPEIPLSARVFAVADALDAMTSDRPYRKALSHEQAMAAILRERGGQFCPDCVDALARIPTEELVAVAQGDRPSLVLDRSLA